MTEDLTGRLLVAVPEQRDELSALLSVVARGQQADAEDGEGSDSEPLSGVVPDSEDDGDSDGPNANLGDIFDRSVVLILHHAPDDGAHGLVLNRPLGANVDVVLPGWQEHVTDPQCLFQGGPVSLDSALGLVELPSAESTVGIKRLFGGVGLVDLDAPPVVVMPEISHLRIFAGYAGWTSGQLEEEIRAGGWIDLPAEPGDAFRSDPEDLWRSVLRRQGLPLSLLADYPRDPNLN